MAGSHAVAFFAPYEFHKGQKIHIRSGPRSGDWEVVHATEKKVRLRCPVSFREFEWDGFCFHVEDGMVAEWPQRD